jgi:hypothetical protein
MPLGRMRHLQAVIARVYHLLTKEAAYGPNLHHMEDFRAAQSLEKSLDLATKGPPHRTKAFRSHTAACDGTSEHLDKLRTLGERNGMTLQARRCSRGPTLVTDQDLRHVRWH